MKLNHTTLLITGRVTIVPELPVDPLHYPSTSSIMMSWTSPQLTPSSYTVSYSCQLLCGSQQTPGTATVDGGDTTHIISSLNAGSSCTVSVTAVFGSNSSNTVTSSTNTTSAGTTHQSYLSSVHELHVSSPAPTGAPGGLNSTSVESRSLSIVWGTVPCPQQRGPITGYRLHYSSSSVNSSVNLTGEENRQYNLTGLTPYTNYSVQLKLAAVNDGGTGPHNESSLTVETLQGSK